MLIQEYLDQYSDSKLLENEKPKWTSIIYFHRLNYIFDKIKSNIFLIQSNSSANPIGCYPIHFILLTQIDY